MIGPDAAFSVLLVVFSVLLSDRFGAVDELIDSGRGNLQLPGDLLDLHPTQFLHLERLGDSLVLGIHQRLDILILQFCADLLVHGGGGNRLISRFNQAIPGNDGGLPDILELAVCAGIGVGTSDERLSYAGDLATGAGIPAGMLGVEIRPLILGKFAAFYFQEVDRHSLRTVEVQRPAVIPCDAVIVQIRLILNLDRHVV